MLTFSRFIAIVGLAFVTIIVAPAHWVSGSPWWTVAARTYSSQPCIPLLTLGGSLACWCCALRLLKLGSSTDGDGDLSSTSNVSSRFSQGGHGLCQKASARRYTGNEIYASVYDYGRGVSESCRHETLEELLTTCEL